MKRSTIEALDFAADLYHGCVGDVARYLEDRGIDEAAASSFRLGLVADPLPGHEQMAGRLSIPYITPSGVVGMKFRRLAEDGSPKYLTLSGFKSRLFNAHAVLGAGGMLAITEGELDAVVLQERCGIPAVGVPGVSSWKRHYRRVFADWPTILAFGDGDEPGREFSKFLAREVEAVVIDMPDGMDVTSLFMAEGADEVLRRAGVPVPTADGFEAHAW